MSTTTSRIQSQMRELVAQAVRILAKDGIFEMNVGHVSGRLPGTDHICVLGHLHLTGRTYARATADDIAIIDLDGDVVEGDLEGPGERFIHTEIYRARPDVGGVVHAHPLVATVLGIAGHEILPVNTRGSLFHPKVPLLDYAAHIDTPELGRRCVEALGDGFALSLRHHGVITVGRTVEEAVCVTLALERTATMQWMAGAVGQARAIPVEFLDGRCIRGMHGFEEYFTSAWAFHREKDPLLMKTHQEQS